MKKRLMALVFALTAMLVTGCASQNSHIISGASQVELRNMQTRAFDMTDNNKMLRAVIATLQDLGFIIDKADDDIGTVTGTKLSGYQVRMTVTVRSRGETQLLVRANATYNLRAIEDPQPYQDFFNALGKSLFLTAHNVD